MATRILKMTLNCDNNMDCIIENISKSTVTATYWYNFVITQRKLQTNASKDQLRELNNFANIVEKIDDTTIYVAHLVQKDRFCTFDDNTDDYRYSCQSNNVKVPLIVTLVVYNNKLPYVIHTGTFVTAYGQYKQIKGLTTQIHKYATQCCSNKLVEFFGNSTIVTKLFLGLSFTNTILLLKQLYNNRDQVKFGDYTISVNHKEFASIMQNLKSNQLYYKQIESIYNTMTSPPYGIKQNLSTDVVNSTNHVVRLLLEEQYNHYFMVNIKLNF